MSRHFFSTLLHGEAVRICMGWDRPLQGFFMTAQYVPQDRRGAFLYCNLDEEIPHPATPEPFEQVLGELGIAVPPQMMAEVIADGMLDVGNKTVIWSCDNGIHVRKEGEYPL